MLFASKQAIVLAYRLNLSAALRTFNLTTAQLQTTSSDRFCPP
jgi:hypothetical protein